MLVLVQGRWAASELELLSRVKMYLAAGGRGEMAQNSGCGVGFLFAWYQVKNFTNSGFHTADLSSAALSSTVTFLLEYKQGFYLGCYLAAVWQILPAERRRPERLAFLGSAVGNRVLLVSEWPVFLELHWFSQHRSWLVLKIWSIMYSR